MQLLPFQQRGRALARRAYAEGKRAILYVAPTGAGKTVILGDTAASHLRNGGTRVSVYAHRRELLHQAAATFRAFGLDVGVFGEGAAHPVQVLSTQGALAKGEVQACTLAVFDESHHYAADDWRVVFDAHKNAGTPIVGATATPERGDGRALDMFDHIVVVAQPKELIKAGRLVPCDWQGPARRVPKGKLARSPLWAHQQHARERRNVIFAPNLKSARQWLGHFTLAGVPSGMVWGAQKAEERDRVLADFKAGRIMVVFNCGVLTEGWDMPELGVVTIARTVGSAGALIQMAGRGARVAPGKDHYTLLDLSGACLSYGLPDDDRQFSLEGVGISRGSGVAGASQRLCKRCKAEIFEDVCPRCQFDNGQLVPGDAGIDLGRWDAKRALDNTPDKRAMQLARWMQRQPGKNPKFYAYKFNAVYGTWPHETLMAMARRMVDGAR